MAKIEKKLHQLHQSAREQRQGSQSSQSEDTLSSPTHEMQRELGFAHVTLVSSGSPAAAAVSSHVLSISFTNPSLPFARLALPPS